MTDLTIEEAIQEYLRLIANTENDFVEKICQLDTERTIDCVDSIMLIHLTSYCLFRARFFSKLDDKEFLDNARSIMEDLLKIGRNKISELNGKAT